MSTPLRASSITRCLFPHRVRTTVPLPPPSRAATGGGRNVRRHAVLLKRAYAEPGLVMMLAHQKPRGMCPKSRSIKTTTSTTPKRPLGP
jgi:hypothetical protein